MSQQQGTALAIREVSVSPIPSREEWATMIDMAERLLKTGFLPQHIKTPEQATAIMLKGRELNVPAMYALAHIVVINGKPACDAELMLALVQRTHGIESLWVEESTNDHCTVAYKVGSQTKHYTFTMEDAQRAGLPQRNQVWRSYPAAMLRARAISASARMAYPGAIAGMYVVGELGDPVSVTSEGEVISAYTPSVTVQTLDPETGEIADSTPGYMGTDDVPMEEPQEAQYRPVQEGPSERQMNLIHALKKDARMSDTELHQEIYETWGKTSLKDLTRQETSALIESMKEIITRNKLQPKQQAQRPTDDPAALASMARQPQLTPARQHALTRFRKALDLALIEHEEWWIQDKLNAPVQAEQVMASTLNAWAEEIEKNPRAANDWYEITKSQKDGLMPSEEELGR